MAAEVGQEIAFFNIAAGVLADRNSIVDGPSGYTSRLSMDFQNESLVGGLDLKTKMRNSKKHSTVGIEFGPRLARRFRNGVEFFHEGFLPRLFLGMNMMAIWQLLEDRFSDRSRSG
jgi:hypothetical protein